MLNATENTDEYFELIMAAYAGMPITILIGKLPFIVVALCQDLDDAGRDSYALLKTALDSDKEI